MNTEWKPIASAPKDGTEVWAYNGEQARMRWTEGECYALWIWADDLVSDADPCPDQPTHWMPLPPAPTSHPIPTGATGEDEQSAFERWFERTCPSGDVESVQRQWESSSDYADLHAPAAGDALDAARYRWLKGRNGGSIGIVAWHRDEEQEMVLVDEHADAAIDAAIAQQKGEA